MRESRKDGHRTERNQPEDRMKKERQVRQGKSPEGTGDRREQYHHNPPGQGSRRERKRRDERRKGGITTEQNRDQPPPRGRKTEGKK